MAPKRFKTDLRLWFCISFALFTIPWLTSSYNYFEMPPARVLIELCIHPTNIHETIGILEVLAILGGMISIPAVCLGWILQCVVVMVRDAKR